MFEMKVLPKTLTLRQESLGGVWEDKGLEKCQEDAWPLQPARDGDLHGRLKHKIVFQKTKHNTSFGKLFVKMCLIFLDLSDLLFIKRLRDGHIGKG